MQGIRVVTKQFDRYHQSVELAEAPRGLAEQLLFHFALLNL